MPLLSKSARKDDFSVKAYLGDGAVLLAFNLPPNDVDNFAGFAVECIAPTKGPFADRPYWLKNLLSFEKPMTSSTKVKASHLTNSNVAPFQAFHWVHYPGAGEGQ